MNEVKTDPWSGLAELMNGLKKEYSELLDLLSRKQSALINGETKKVDELVKQEQAKVNDIEKLEVKRAEAAGACIPDAENPTLKDILEKAPEESGKKLEKAAVDLLECMNEATAANRRVAELVQESMGFVTYQLNLMDSDKPQEGVYKDDGRVKEEKPKIRGIFNRQA